mmetsp:Transcript_4234/g.12947  ORF Transcript_4234/g.12947 Transcript_4234/m.12947 type:complete len:244 (+) Transcript_4234:2209-2940(+)
MDEGFQIIKILFLFFVIPLLLNLFGKVANKLVTPETNIFSRAQQLETQQVTRAFASHRHRHDGKNVCKQKLVLFARGSSQKELLQRSIERLQELERFWDRSHTACGTSNLSTKTFESQFLNTSIRILRTRDQKFEFLLELTIFFGEFIFRLLSLLGALLGAIIIIILNSHRILPLHGVWLECFAFFVFVLLLVLARDGIHTSDFVSHAVSDLSESGASAALWLTEKERSSSLTMRSFVGARAT